MNKLKQNNKKYINRKFLKNLMEDNGNGLLYKALLKARAKDIELE